MAVPRRGAPDPGLCLYQYAAIDEFTHLNFLAVCPKQSTYPSAGFLRMNSLPNMFDKPIRRQNSPFAPEPLAIRSVSGYNITDYKRYPRSVRKERPESVMDFEVRFYRHRTEMAEQVAGGEALRLPHR